jgi:hypothetical protein
VDDARDKRRRGDPEGRSPVVESFYGRQWRSGGLLQAVARTGRGEGVGDVGECEGGSCRGSRLVL